MIRLIRRAEKNHTPPFAVYWSLTFTVIYAQVILDEFIIKQFRIFHKSEAIDYRIVRRLARAADETVGAIQTVEHLETNILRSLPIWNVGLTPPSSFVSFST
jgi:hypothetical protein